MHTGVGMFSFNNACVEGFGRTTTDRINSAIAEDTSNLNFAHHVAKLSIKKQGNNQISRCALHTHHSMDELRFHGNTIIDSPRNGMVAHNSRGHITDNVVVAVNGSGAFLEDSTETGPVKNNFFIGAGGGSRGGDADRFAKQSGIDMGVGGFGIWARGIYANITNNRAEGHFGLAPCACFAHPGTIEDKPVPDVTGTSSFLVGKSSKQVSSMLNHDLTLQTFGRFKDNSAYETRQTGLGLSYFGKPAIASATEGHIIGNLTSTSLAKSGCLVATTHSQIFTMKGGNVNGEVDSNTIN